MSDPYLGEIRLFGGNFAPAGWAFCDGALLAIAQNNNLFTLIGTTYGGNGSTTFGLPDLRGRVPLHQGQGSLLSNRTLGEAGGLETVTLGGTQIPSHNHPPASNSNAGNSADPANRYWAANSNTAALQFTNSAPNANMIAGAVGTTGGSQPHENLIPYLAISYIISLSGVFPS